jgi:PAS domain S-box-containing protein/diguanylate cyclase (GGDEF)-like protein
MSSTSLARPSHGAADGLLVGADLPYRATLEQMGEGVATLSADGRLIYANPRLAELLERPRETLLGRPLAELLPPAQRDCLERLRKVSAGRSERAELELLRDSGGTRRVLATVSGLESDGIGTQCLTLTDLSHLQAPAQALASDDHRYRLLAEAVAAFVLETDGERRVRWVSPSVQAVLGWMPQELIGGSITDLLHRDDSLQARPPAGQEQPVVRLRARDGTERWMRALSWPLTGEGRTPCGWISGFQDVDELVAQRRARALDQARLAAVLSSLPGAQIVLDTLRRPDGGLIDFVCVAANDAACHQLGLPRHALVGRRLLAGFPVPAAADLFALCSRALHSHPGLAIGESGLRVARVGDVLSCSWGERVRIGAEAAERRSPPATGLASVSELLERLSRLHHPGHRRTQPLALACCHLRHLRAIHDGHGADSAERVLQTIEARLRRLLRHDSIVARVSIDQLLVVLGGMDSHAQAAATAESIRVVLGLPLPVLDASIRITPSVGVTLERPGDRLEDLIGRALIRGADRPGRLSVL